MRTGGRGRGSGGPRAGGCPTPARPLRGAGGAPVQDGGGALGLRCLGFGAASLGTGGARNGHASVQRLWTPGVLGVPAVVPPRGAAGGASPAATPAGGNREFPSDSASLAGALTEVGPRKGPGHFELWRYPHLFSARCEDRLIPAPPLSWAASRGWPTRRSVGPRTQSGISSHGGPTTARAQRG